MAEYSIVKQTVPKFGTNEDFHDKLPLLNFYSRKNTNKGT